MNLTDQKSLESLLGFDSEEDRIAYSADRIQLDILGVIMRRMEELGLSKSELATRVGVSKSYVSQLFSTDKRLSLKTLARLEDALEGRFNIRFSDVAADFEAGNVIELMRGGSRYTPESFHTDDISGQQQAG